MSKMHNSLFLADGPALVREDDVGEIDSLIERLEEIERENKMK